MIRRRTKKNGFTLVETLFSILVMGFIMVSIASVFVLMQKSSNQATGYTDAQQNARVSVDYITDIIRQAGVNADYVRGQLYLVHGGPYQIAINADIDNGQQVAGQNPLNAIDVDSSPNTVPSGGTTIYAPQRTFTTGAETVVLTLDSNGDGVINTSDRGDDVEEQGINQHLYSLQKISYGADGSGSNDVQSTSLALLRGPVGYPDGSVPPPLFQYYYDDDENPITPDLLWGDDSPQDGELNSAEIAALTEVPDTLLAMVRQVKVTVIGESNKFDNKFDYNDGFSAVTMTSEAYLRNSGRNTSVIIGKVFHDGDGDGILDASESGIPDVEIQLVGTSKSTTTDNFGKFFMPLGPGAYSIKEVDPFGYTSTTPNLVSVTLGPGQAHQVQFGDISSGGSGIIHGKVFDDLDFDGIMDPGEAGIEEVLLSLNTGDQILTDRNGAYSFTVQIGNYNLVETDKDGYSSTTPNDVEIVISADGDTMTVDFGDAMNLNMGTIEGYVFNDDDRNGVKGFGEGGLADVSMHLSSGDSTITNAEGFYQFSISPGVYDLKEIDPEGYTSTTVNNYVDILVTPDTSITINFGDIPDNDADFIEIVIGDTERALSVKSLNLKEDNKNDQDIVLGTPFSGAAGNLLVYKNKYKNANTSITQLFESFPSYRRNANTDINTIAVADLSGDDTWDVTTGQEYNIANNVLVWFTGGQGELSNSPDHMYTSDNNTFVMDSKMIDYNNDGILDLILGLRTSTGLYTGAIQTFRGQGGGVFSADELITITKGGSPLGEIWAVDAGDLDGDGDVDIVAGSNVSEYWGYLEIFLNGSAGDGTGTPGNFFWKSRYLAIGRTNDIEVIDMMEDNQGDPDIIAAHSMSANSGVVLLWHNTNGFFGERDTTGAYYGPEVTPSIPSDIFYPYGECLSIDIAHINRDLFPDVLVGTKTSDYYTGDLLLLKTYGVFPTYGIQLNESAVGEVNTIDMADFNKDNKNDIVIGTRTSITQGKLVIYFYDE
jgi:type II secretory pathway pseudopilin PulG